MIEQVLQRGAQMICIQRRRHGQQHRLAEAVDRSAALGQPPHDRRRRQRTHRDVGRRCGRFLPGARDRRQRRHRLMLEHGARRDRQPGPARPADQLDRHDAVAAEFEEVVVDADLRNPQRLGEQPAQHLLVRRPRQAPDHIRRHHRRRQRAAVELAVRRQRQPLQRDERRRHHVVRQQPHEMPPQRRSIRRRHAGRRRAGLRHHVGNEPQRTAAATAAATAVAARARSRARTSGLIRVHTTVTARHHGGLRHRVVPQQRRLDLARLDPEAAQLDLRVRPPEELQDTIAAPARQVAGAVHPAARRPERIGHEPLRRQARTAQIAPRQTRPRNVQLTSNTRRHRRQLTVQNVRARVRDRPPDRNMPDRVVSA